MGWHTWGGRGTVPVSCWRPGGTCCSGFRQQQWIKALHSSCVQRHDPLAPGVQDIHSAPVSLVLEKPALPSPSSKATSTSWSCVLNYLRGYLTKLLFPKEIKTKRKTTCNYTTYFQKYLFCIIICSPAKTWKLLKISNSLSKLLLSSSLAPGLFSHIF